MIRVNHLTTALTLVCCAGMCWAQPTTRVSGILHTPIGGATFDPPVGRALTIRGLGASGLDGVHVHSNSAGGAVCSADLGALMRTPGARCAVRAVDDSGVSLGEVRVNGLGGGRCAMIGDFSAIGAISVEWVVRDTSGRVLAEGTRSGALLECIVNDPSAMAAGAPGVWSVGRKSKPDLQSWSMKICPRVVWVEGLTGTPIVGVGQIEMRPILCITAPCPGDGTSMSGLRVTAGGLASLTVQDASLIRTCAIAPGSATASDGVAVVHRGLSHWGSSDVAIEEGCDLPPPVACAPVDRVLHVSGFGSSGDQGVTFDLGSTTSTTVDRVVHRDLAARSVAFDMVVRPGSGGGGGAGGSLTVTAKGRKSIYVGHVTLIKQRVAFSPGGGMPVVKFDPTTRGSTQTRIECLSQDGGVVATAIVGADEGVQIPGCLNPDGSMTLRGVMTDVGSSEVRCCSVSSEVILPGGTVVSGVERVRFSPLAPNVPAGVLDELNVTGGDLHSVDVTRVEVGTPIWVGGLAMEGVGQGTLRKTVEGGLQVLNIGSSGQDGVSVHIDARKGGQLRVDLSALLNPPAGVERRISFSEQPKDWDVRTTGDVHLVGTPSGIVETNDFSALGATSVEWQLLSSSGRVLASGEVSGPVASWTIGVAGVETVDKVYSFSAARGEMSVREGFFDRVVPISGLTPVPVQGVASISVTPRAGGPGGGAAAASYAATGRVLVTGAGIGTLHLSGCAMTYDGPVAADVDGDGFGDDVFVHGVGNGVVAAVGEGLAGAIEVSNLGSSGQDGVELSHERLGIGGSLEFGLTSAYPLARDGQKSITMNIRARQQASQALCVFTEERDAASLRTLLKWTGTAWESRQVSFFDDSGQLLGTRTVGLSEGIFISARDGEQLDTWTVTGNAVKLRFETAPVEVSLSGGGLTVSQVRWMVIGGDAVPGSPLGEANGVQILARGQNPVKLGGCILRPPINMRGVPIRPRLKTYGEFLADQGGRVVLRTPAAAGGQPAEAISCTMVCDTGYGRSVAFDATELLTYAGPGGGPHVRCAVTDARGVVGTVRASVRSGAVPGQLLHTMDFSKLGAVGVRWSLLGAGGATIASGQVAGATLDWTSVTTVLEPTKPLSIDYRWSKTNREMLESVANGESVVSGGFVGATGGVRGVRCEPVLPEGAVVADTMGMDLEADGMTSLVITDAAAHTFGVETKVKARPATKFHSRVKESFDRVSGQTSLSWDSDGDVVELEMRPPRAVDDMTVSAAKYKTGHISLIKFTDDAGQERARLIETGVEGGLESTTACDFSGSGATGVTAWLLGAGDVVLASFPCDNGRALRVVHSQADCPVGTGESFRMQKRPRWWPPANQGALHRFCAPAEVELLPGGSMTGVHAVAFTPVGGGMPGTKVALVEITRSMGDGTAGATVERLAITGVEAVDSSPRCNPADIAFDDGSALPPVGVSGADNNGVTEADYNLFFAQFFDAGAACDIANDNGSPLPPFGVLDTNNGVTEGDYNLFFSIFFDGCAL